MTSLEPLSSRRAWAGWLIVVSFLLGACATSNQPPAVPHVNANFVVEEAIDRLDASTPAPYAHFASSVAVDGEMVAVGAWGEAGAGRDSGAVYVYERTDPGWALEAHLTSPAPAAAARFGHAVALDDGVLLVGALYDPRFGDRAGAVYVFEEQAGTWIEQAVLRPDAPLERGHFGAAVALSENTAVVGASGPGGQTVYVFQRADEGWRQQAQLAPIQPFDSAHFGSSVALHDDVAVVGAWVDPPDEGFEQPGGPSSAFVFERIEGEWVERAQLTAGTPSTWSTFGRSVAVDGDLIVIGAPGEGEAAYAFRRHGPSWELEAAFAPEASSVEHFGVSVAVERDVVVVGAPGHGGRAGTAYVFTRGPAAWQGRSRIVAPDAAEGLQLAGVVAMDHGLIVLGATGDAGAGAASGAAYTYR